MFRPEPQPKNELAQAMSSGKKSYVFPKDLETIDHWMAIRAHKHKFRQKKDFPVKEALGIAYLPMPQQLPVTYSQDYASEGVGAAGASESAAAFAGGVGGLIQGVLSGGVSGGLSSLKDTKDQFAGIEGQMGGLAMGATYYGYQAAEEGIASAVGGAIGGPIGAAAGAAATQAFKGGLASQGISRNPYLSQLYQQPQLRSFQFTWKLVPKSVDEQNELDDLIAFLKYHQAPGFKGGEFQHFFDYPDQFDVDFHHQDYTFNIGPSVMTNLTIDYHGEGEAMYHNIGAGLKAPAVVNLGFTLTETTIVTKQNIKYSNRKEGDNHIGTDR